MAHVWVKIKSFFSNITIEPLFFFYAMCIGFYAIASKTLYIQKVCKVNFNISEEICNNIQRHEEEQNKVQAYVSQLQAYNDIIQGIIPFVLAIFAGPWSDIYGRRKLMISAVFGYSLCNLVFFLNTLYFYELKAEFLLFEAIQGNQLNILMGTLKTVVPNIFCTNSLFCRLHGRLNHVLFGQLFVFGRHLW